MALDRRQKAQASEIAPRLLAWFDRRRRDLPWRRTRDLYRIWVSEIMLQQTQVATVIPYFEQFVQAFPDVRALAEAPLDDVLRLWAGLGYYSRARNLHRAARAIVEEHGGRFPETYAGILTLPGVGEYTAGAIASIAFGERVPAIDGNAARVLARVSRVADDVRTGRGRRRVEELGQAAVPEDRPGDYNQALMELGALICRPQAPLCDECCLSDLCAARRRGEQEALPRPRKRTPTRLVYTAAAIARRNGRVLIAQRPPEGVWGGMWEFPNTDVAGDEDVQRKLQQLLREEFGLEVGVEHGITRLTHGIMDRRIELTAHACAVLSGRTQAKRHVAAKWVRPEELDDYALPAPHRRIAGRLKEAGST